MTPQVAAISPDYDRYTTLALNHLLKMGGEFPPELRPTESLLREHEGRMRRMGVSPPQLPRLTTTSLTTHGTQGEKPSGSAKRVGLFSPCLRHPRSPISPKAGLGDASFWGVVIEEGAICDSLFIGVRSLMVPSILR
jgi:hypothetical protein